MAKKVKWIRFLGMKIPVIGEVVDGVNGEPVVVLTEKKNVGRNPTRAKTGILPPPDFEDSKDGIWLHEMTKEQKTQYGIFPANWRKKKGAKKNED